MLLLHVLLTTPVSECFTFNWRMAEKWTLSVAVALYDLIKIGLYQIAYTTFVISDMMILKYPNFAWIELDHSQQPESTICWQHPWQGVPYSSSNWISVCYLLHTNVHWVIFLSVSGRAGPNQSYQIHTPLMFLAS